MLRQTFISLVVSCLVFGGKAQQNINQKEKPLYIEVIVATPGFSPDSLQFVIDENSLGTTTKQDIRSLRKIWVKKTNEKFIYKENNLKSPAYLHVFKRDKDNAMRSFFDDEYLVMPGDSVTIKISLTKDSIRLGYGGHHQYSLDFTGRGVAKYKLKRDLYFQPFINSTSSKTLRTVDENLKYNYDNYLDEEFRIRYSILQRYKKSLTTTEYNILYADILSESQLGKIKNLGVCLKNTDGFSENKRIIPSIKVENVYLSHFAKDKLAGMPDNIKYASKNYSIYAVDKAMFWIRTFKSQRDTLGYVSVYDDLKKSYSGIVREKVLAKFFLEFYRVIQPDKMDSLVEDALLYVKDADLAFSVGSFRNLSVGKSVFPFVLPDVNGKLISASSFNGKILFIDFWFTGCVHCISYYKNAVSPTKELFKHDSNVVFMSISMDMSKEEWLESVRSQKYTSEDAINVFTNYKGFGHELIKYYNITGGPFPLLIDQSGKIYSFGHSIRPKEDLIMKIEELRKDKNNAIASLQQKENISAELFGIIEDDNLEQLKASVRPEDFGSCFSKYTLLHQTIRTGAKKCFDYLLQQNVDVNTVCEGYLPPLMHAAKYGRLDMAKALVGKGARIDYQYSGILSFPANDPIGLADFYKHIELADYLRRKLNEKGIK